MDQLPLPANMDACESVTNLFAQPISQDSFRYVCDPAVDFVRGMIPHHQAGAFEAFLSTLKICRFPRFLKSNWEDTNCMGHVDPQGAVDMCVAVDGVQSWMEAKDMSQ